MLKHQPDIVFAQEAHSPSFDQLPDYQVAFAPRVHRKVGLAVCLRTSIGALESEHVSSDADDLACWAQVGDRRTLLVSTHVNSRRNANHAVDRALFLAAGAALIIGGDFNAGPSIGANKPGPYAVAAGLRDLTHAEPELNTIRRARQTRDFQIDHIFARGFNRVDPVHLLRYAEADGPGLSDHNGLLVEVVA